MKIVYISEWCTIYVCEYSEWPINYCTKIIKRSFVVEHDSIMAACLPTGWYSTRVHRVSKQCHLLLNDHLVSNWILRKITKKKYNTRPKVGSLNKSLCPMLHSKSQMEKRAEFSSSKLNLPQSRGRLRYRSTQGSGQQARREREAQRIIIMCRMQDLRKAWKDVSTRNLLNDKEMTNKIKMISRGEVSLENIWESV